MGGGRLIEEHTYTFSTVIGQQLKRKNKANEGTPRAQRDRNNENEKKLSSYTDSALVEDKIVVNIMAMKQVFLVFLLFKSRRRRSTSSRGQGEGRGTCLTL